MTVYHPFVRNYRKIEQAELDAACRGLRMTYATDARLQEIVREHKDLDAFASQVIEEAAKREMATRCCANYTAITHDDHKGMGTGQATWRDMWGVCVRHDDGNWWIHVQCNSEQAAYERMCELIAGSEFWGTHNVTLVKPDGEDDEELDYMDSCSYHAD